MPVHRRNRGAATAEHNPHTTPRDSTGCRTARKRLSALALAPLLICLACLPAVGAAYDMQQHHWQHRLLFLVADRADTAGIRAQRQAIADNAAGIDERHLRVFELFAADGSVDGTPLDADSVADLRQRLAVEPGERALILVGKDGGIKRRAGLDTPLAEIFAQIDGMPMRRAEMREQRQRRLQAD